GRGPEPSGAPGGIRGGPIRHPHREAPMPVATRSAPLLLALALLIPLSPVTAQGGEDVPRPVSGVVVDEGSGTPVPGALVAMVERNHAVFTDEEGRFTLREVEAGSHGLVVTQLG